MPLNGSRCGGNRGSGEAAAATKTSVAGVSDGRVEDGGGGDGSNLRLRRAKPDADSYCVVGRTD